MMPDPAGTAAADPANPQSWNRYAYVMNNPLNATDPLGLYCYFGDGATIGVSGPREIGNECGSDALEAGKPDPNKPPHVDTPPMYVYADADPIETIKADIAMFVSLAKSTWHPHSTTPIAGTQTKNSQPCAPQSGYPSMGWSASGSTVNPFTSKGGGVWGYNRQSFGATTNSYTYSGKGVGLDVGGSVQSVWALGHGSWTGPFHSVNFAGGPFAGSVFWTPGKGGWTGFSFGLGIGFPGAAYEETNYTCRSAQ